MRQTIIFMFLILLAVNPARAGESEAEKAIRAAILDFAEGCYVGDTERVARAFHPDLDKGGFWRRPGEAYQSGTHSYEEIIEECRTLYTARVALPDNPRLEIVIFDILDQTASAKLTAEWGVDFFHLAKYNGRWRIKNSLGEAHPAN